MRRLLVGFCLALLVTTLGCASEGPSAGDSGEGESSGETGPEDEFQPPVFIDPASGVLTLAHDQLDDPFMRVADVIVGRTQLEIDGELVGTLLSPGPIGHLEAESLRLRTDGAMLKGTHNIRLVTPGTTAPQASAVIDVRIVPATLPDVSHELGANVVATGVHAIATGTGDRGMLLVLAADGPQDAVLSMLPAAGTNWDMDALRTLPLPGYVSDDDGARGAVSAAMLPDGDPAAGDSTPRVRVAWRVGSPGERIDAVELVWGEDENEVGETHTVLKASQIPDVEWARARRPAFIGADLVVEVRAPANTEQALPGDEALYAVRWPVGADPHVAQRVTFGPAVDVDLTGRAVDLAREDVELGLRVDGRRVTVMRWDPITALPELVGPDPSVELSDQSGDVLGMATVMGAFGSQTTALARADGEVRVVLQDAADDGGRTAYPDADDLPDEVPSGPPAATVGLGTPIFLIPYANAAEVVALVVDGERTQVQPLPGLFCDEVALPATAKTAEDGAMAFACIQDGDMRLGALFASKG